MVFFLVFPVGIYFFIANNGTSGTICEVCSKLKINATERSHRRLLVSLLSTVSTHCSGGSIVDYEQVKGCWVALYRVNSSLIRLILCLVF